MIYYDEGELQPVMRELSQCKAPHVEDGKIRLRKTKTLILKRHTQVFMHIHLICWNQSKLNELCNSDTKASNRQRNKQTKKKAEFAEEVV